MKVALVLVTLVCLLAEIVLAQPVVVSGLSSSFSVTVERLGSTALKVVATYNAGGWVAVGFNNAGQMGGRVVMGCQSCTNQIQQYRLSQYSAQPITNENIYAQYSKVGSVHTIEFVATHLDGLSLIDASHLLVAGGNSAGSSPTKHTVKNVVAVDFSGAAISATSGPTAGPTQSPVPPTTAIPTAHPSVSPTQSPVPPTLNPSANPTPSPIPETTVLSMDILNGKGKFTWTDFGTEEYEFALEYDATTGWLGVGLASDEEGRMAGALAVLGTSSGSIGEYDLSGRNAGLLQSKSADPDYDIEISNGKMRVTFKASGINGRAFKFDGEDTLIFGYGTSAAINKHSIREAQTVNWATGLSQSSSTVKMWLAHGSCMILAFGICFPLGAWPSIARKLFSDSTTWFMLHRGIQITGVLLAGSGLLLAIANSDVHFDETHGIVGLVLVSLAFMQPTLAILFRKGKTRPIWKASHYLFALLMIGGGAFNIYGGVDLSEAILSEGRHNVMTLGFYVSAGLSGLTIVTVAITRAIGLNEDAHAAAGVAPEESKIAARGSPPEL